MAKGKRVWSNTGGSSDRREPQTAAPPLPLPQGQPKPCVLGPCFTCRGIGHPARTCPKKSLCPLYQPVVNSAEGSHVAESFELPGVKSMGSKCAKNTKNQFPALETNKLLMTKQI